MGMGRQTVECLMAGFSYETAEWFRVAGAGGAARGCEEGEAEAEGDSEEDGKVVQG